jgi:hypothetical protein
MVGALLLVTGCDKLFGLDEVPPARDAAATDGLGIDAPHACLDGTFSTSFDNGKLEVVAAAGGTTNIVNGQVVISWPSGHSNSNYGHVETQARFDLSAGEVAVDLVAFSGDKADANFYMRTANGEDYTISVDLATVLLYVNTGSGDQQVDSMPYGVLPLHLRIFSAPANMVTFEASVDTGTFTRSVPATVPLQSVSAGFSAGSYDSALGSGSATFDNFLVASPTCL